MHSVSNTKEDECLLLGYIMSHMQYFITYIHAYIHTHTYLYKIIKHTFEEKKTIMFMGVESLWDPVFILGTLFFQTNGVPGPCFFNP